MKVYSRFHGLPSNRQYPFNITATPSSKAQAMTTTPQKSIVLETNFHIWDTWSIRRHYPRHCTILGRKHMYFPLVHSRRDHILGHNTECNVALDQCSCSKTSGVVFCVSKGHSVGLWYIRYWRWILYILRLVWNFSCLKVEWIDLADLISILGEFF